MYAVVTLLPLSTFSIFILCSICLTSAAAGRHRRRPYSMAKVQKARLLVVAIVVFLLNSLGFFPPESVVAKCCESPLRAPGLHGHWVGGGGGLPGRPEAGRWFPYLFF